MKTKLLIISSIILLSLVSCSKDTSSDGIIRLTAFIGEPKPAMPVDGTIVGDKIKEITGYDVEMEYVVGDLATRTGIMLASGDLPDFLNARNEHDKFRDEGYLIPLEDLILEHAPNLRKMIGNHWDKLFTDGAEGNHIYAIPDLITYGDSTLTRPENAWYIQKVILKEAGWPKVTTFQEYFKLIEEYKAKNPTINNRDTIGFQINTHDWYKWYFYENAAENLSGYADSLFRVNKIDGKWKLEPTLFQEDVKMFYKEMNKLYHKGIIDPEGFVNTLDQYNESIASGRVLGTFQPSWVIQPAMDILKTDMPERTFVALPLVWEDGIKDVYNNTKTPTTGRGTSITTSCKDPIAAIKYLDAISKDEIQMLGYWGVEGVDYYRDENGRVNRTKVQNDNFTNRSGDYYFPIWGGEYYIEHWPSIDGTFADGTATRYGNQPEIFRKDLTASEKEILDEMGWETFNSAFTPDSDPEIADRAAYKPLYNIEAETGSIEQVFANKLENQIRPVYYPQLIMAEDMDKFEATWNEFKDEVTSTIGYQQFINYFQKVVDQRARQ